MCVPLLCRRGHYHCVFRAFCGYSCFHFLTSFTCGEALEPVLVNINSAMRLLHDVINKDHLKEGPPIYRDHSRLIREPPVDRDHCRLIREPPVYRDHSRLVREPPVHRHHCRLVREPPVYRDHCRLVREPPVYRDHCSLVRT